MSAGDPLGELIAALEDPEFQEGLRKLVRLVKNLERSGLLDMLLALTDEEVLGRLFQLLLSPGTLRLLDNLDTVADKMAAVMEALEKPSEPVSLTGVVASLRDPEVARGLARMIEVLRVLGQ